MQYYKCNIIKNAIIHIRNVMRQNIINMQYYEHATQYTTNIINM